MNLSRTFAIIVKQAMFNMKVLKAQNVPYICLNNKCTGKNSEITFNYSFLRYLNYIELTLYFNCVMSQDLSLEAEKDPYSQWSFQDVFNEDCIVLDPVSVLPVQYEITNCLLPISQGKNMDSISSRWSLEGALAFHC